MRRWSQTARAALIGTAALAAAACGGGSPPEPTAAPTAIAESDLPSVEIIDVATGATVNLASFAPADRPIVLWFWAPH